MPNVKHQHSCARCGHVWMSYTEPRPNRCSKCKAKYWWRPRREPKVGIEEGGGLGRPQAFPQLDTLEVGKALLIPFRETLIGHGADVQSVPDEIYNSRISQYVNAHARRSGREYHTSGKYKEGSAGLLVRRVA